MSSSGLVVFFGIGMSMIHGEAWHCYVTGITNKTCPCCCVTCMLNKTGHCSDTGMLNDA